MDMNKVRALTRPELEAGHPRRQAGPLAGPLRARDAPAEEDYTVISGSRRTVARILTVKHERKLGKTA